MAFSPDPFFIGWAKKPPKALQGFLVIVGVGLVLGLTAAGVMVGATQADPEGGTFRFDLREQTLTGLLIAKPYPMLYLDEDPESHFASRTIMLNGNGKTGVAERALEFDGARVSAKGIILERGNLQMLQLNRRFEALGDGTAPEPEQMPVREDLGRWQITGEICDGRCLVGAMRPGDGVAHKACANLCISGGQPPVFVAHKAVEGATFMLMGSADHGPLPESVLNYTGVPVQIEAKLERVGDLILVLVDPSSVQAL